MPSHAKRSPLPSPTRKRVPAKRKMTVAEFERAFNRGQGFKALDQSTATIHAKSERSPQFLRRIEAARKNLRAGRGIRLEDVDI